MARQTTGIDIGTRSSTFLKGTYKGNTFQVSDYAHNEQPTSNVAQAWEACEIDFVPSTARIGLTGRDVNIRYSRVPLVPDWQLRKLMRFEVEEIGDQSGSEVASDFNVLPSLPEIEGEDVVLLCMARETLLEQHGEGLAELGGKLDAFSPNSLALYNAWLRFGIIEEETVLMANIGHENIDVILVRGPDLLFARNLGGGGKLFDDAIAQRFGVGARKAEEIKIEMASLEPGARFSDPNAEKASRAITGAAGQLLSLLQSTVAFCKSQVRASGLRVDRVYLCGGGSQLRGLPAYLSQAMGVPVELFDPFRVVETDGLDPEASASLQRHRFSSVVALGLATMASDPEAYSVELLPEGERKKREFWGGTAWMIAAAVLAVVYIGYTAVRTKAQLEEVTTTLAGLNGQVRRASSTHNETEALLLENEELERIAQQMQGRAGSGEQLARTLDILNERMPQNFWIDFVASSWGHDLDLGVSNDDPRPILEVKGKAIEAAQSSSTSFGALAKALKDRFGREAVNETLAPSGQEFTLMMTLFAPPDPNAEVDEEGAE